MPITKNELRQIASDAWQVLWENIGHTEHYDVEIDGDSKLIMSVLREHKKELGSRLENAHYIIDVEFLKDKGVYRFKLWENDDLDPDFDFADYDDGNEVVAASVRVLHED